LSKENVTLNKGDADITGWLGRSPNRPSYLLIYLFRVN